jgi:hypothetical protein
MLRLLLPHGFFELCWPIKTGKTLNHLFGIERPLPPWGVGESSHEVQYEGDAAIHQSESRRRGRRRLMAGAGVVSGLPCPSQTA